MKRISLLLMSLALFTGPALPAQDAATEERLNKLAGRIEDLTAGQDALRKQIDLLSREMQELREQVGKPTGNYASQEDLKRVVKAVEDVDRKRLEDADKIQKTLVELSAKLSVPPPKPPRTTARTHPGDENNSEKTVNDKGYECVVQKGDTLSSIAQAYREKNIKVSVEQILAANPGLKAEKMHVGQKLFIPAPQS